MSALWWGGEGLLGIDGICQGAILDTLAGRATAPRIFEMERTGLGG